MHMTLKQGRTGGRNMSYKNNNLLMVNGLDLHLSSQSENSEVCISS